MSQYLQVRVDDISPCTFDLLSHSNPTWHPPNSHSVRLPRFCLHYGLCMQQAECQGFTRGHGLPFLHIKMFHKFFFWEIVVILGRSWKIHYGILWIIFQDTAVVFSKIISFLHVSTRRFLSTLLRQEWLLCAVVIFHWTKAMRLWLGWNRWDALGLIGVKMWFNLSWCA